MGLQNAGKTSLVGVLATGAFQEVSCFAFLSRGNRRANETTKNDRGGNLSTSTSPPPPHTHTHRHKKQDMIPTVGFNMRKVTRGGVTIKLWDLGGQPRFRSMWERYCRGVGAVVFVADAADPGSLDAARAELHDLLSRPSLAGTPLLVLGNKNDLPGALAAADLADKLELSRLGGREVAAYSISCKSQAGVNLVLDWLTKHAK